MDILLLVKTFDLTGVWDTEIFFGDLLLEVFRDETLKSFFDFGVDIVEKNFLELLYNVLLQGVEIFVDVLMTRCVLLTGDISLFTEDILVLGLCLCVDDDI